MSDFEGMIRLTVVFLEQGYMIDSATSRAAQCMKLIHKGVRNAEETKND